MAIVLIEMNSTSAADDVVTAVGAGQLWGIDMGTTSSASSYSKFALVDLTQTRANNVVAAAPDEAFVCIQDSDPSSFTDSTANQKAWYLRGKL